MKRDSRAEIDDTEIAPETPPRRRAAPRDLEQMWDEVLDLQADMRKHFAHHDRKIDEHEERIGKYDRGENGRLQAKIDEFELRETAWKAKALGWTERAALWLGGLAVAWAYSEIRTCIPTPAPAVIMPAMSAPAAASSSPKAAASGPGRL